MYVRSMHLCACTCVCLCVFIYVCVRVYVSAVFFVVLASYSLAMGLSTTKYLIIHKFKIFESEHARCLICESLRYKRVVNFTNQTAV